jgi:hypothetical protein
MNFYIRRNSILPTLKMKLVFDGRNDYKRFHDLLENSVVTFSMKNVNNGVYKVANKEGKIIKVKNGDIDEYYVEYEWIVNDTNELGQFEGEFKIKFLDDCSHIIVPIRENLYINVLTSFTKGDIEENNNLIDGDGCLIYCEDSPFTGGTVSGATEFLSDVTILGNIFSGNTNLEDIFLSVEINDLSLNSLSANTITSGTTNLLDIIENISSQYSGNTFTTGATLSGTTALFNRNDGIGYDLDLSTLSGTTVSNFSLDCSSKILSLEQSNNDNYNVDLSCLLTGITDTFVTGFTFNGINTFTIEQNEGKPDLNATINNLSLISLSATTIFSGDTNLTNIINNIASQYSGNTFVTGGTFNQSTRDLTLNRNDGVNISISGFTDTFTSGSTFDNSTKIATFNRNDGNNYTLNLSGFTISAAGINNNVQFNIGGGFGANNNFNWINSENRLVLGTESVPDANSRMVIIGKGTGTNNTLAIHNSTGTNNALIVRDDGRIGIGTNNPLQRLHVSGSGSERIRLTGAGGNIELYSQASNNTGIIFGSGLFFRQVGASSNTLELVGAGVNPGTRLDLKGGTSDNILVSIQGGGANNTSIISMYRGTTETIRLVDNNVNDSYHNTTRGFVFGGTSRTSQSAQVEMISTDKGLLIPRMTAAQRGAITNPANGLMVIQTDGGAGVEGLYRYEASTTSWVRIG